MCGWCNVLLGTLRGHWNPIAELLADEGRCPWFSPGVVSPLQGQWARSGDILGCHNPSHDDRPRMLLNLLQCTQQSLATTNYLAPKVKRIETQKLWSTPWSSSNCHSSRKYSHQGPFPINFIPLSLLLSNIINSILLMHSLLHCALCMCQALHKHLISSSLCGQVSQLLSDLLETPQLARTGRKKYMESQPFYCSYNPLHHAQAR